MTTGIICIWVGLHAFQKSFAVDEYSEWSPYVLEPEPAQRLSQLAHLRAVPIAKDFDHHLAFH